MRHCCDDGSIGLIQPTLQTSDGEKNSNHNVYGDDVDASDDGENDDGEDDDCGGNNNDVDDDCAGRRCG